MLSPRHRALYIFMIMYFILTVFLGVRLGEWDANLDGHCYLAGSTSTPRASHPSADKAYLAVTASWSIICILLAIIPNERHQKAVLLLAALQFPLHLYMMIAIRGANTHHLSSEESEDDWKYGQTVSIVLVRLASFI